MAELSLQQKSALEQFKKAVSDVPKPEEHDGYLLQWLKARNYDVEKAEKMFRKSMAWREKVGADHILETWKLPEVLQKYYPNGLIGYDKEGCPVWIYAFGFFDSRGLISSLTMDDFILNLIYRMETMRSEIAKQSKLLGRYIYQVIVIVDMEGLTLRNALYKPVIDLVNEEGRIFEANYPECVKKLIVINAPKFFAMVYNIVKLVMSDETKRKTDLFDSDRSQWIPALLELIDADQLPKHWGGTMVDPDGNPKCPSKVCLGGEVPAIYYLNNKNRLPEAKSWELKVIKKGSSLQIDFDVIQSKSRLSWSFQTDGYDIGFYIKRKGSEDVLEEVVPYARVDSHLSIIDGQTEPLEPGKYVVIFDNSYSKLRSKSLYYFVEVISPQSETARKQNLEELLQ